MLTTNIPQHNGKSKRRGGRFYPGNPNFGILTSQRSPFACSVSSPGGSEHWPGALACLCPFANHARNQKGGRQLPSRMFPGADSPFFPIIFLFKNRPAVFPGFLEVFWQGSRISGKDGKIECLGRDLAISFKQLRLCSFALEASEPRQIASQFSEGPGIFLKHCSQHQAMVHGHLQIWVLEVQMLLPPI